MGIARNMTRGAVQGYATAKVAGYTGKEATFNPTVGAASQYATPLAVGAVAWFGLNHWWGGTLNWLIVPLVWFAVVAGARIWPKGKELTDGHGTNSIIRESIKAFAAVIASIIVWLFVKDMWSWMSVLALFGLLYLSRRLRRYFKVWRSMIVSEGDPLIDYFTHRWPVTAAQLGFTDTVTHTPVGANACPLDHGGVEVTLIPSPGTPFETLVSDETAQRLRTLTGAHFANHTMDGNNAVWTLYRELPPNPLDEPQLWTHTPAPSIKRVPIGVTADGVMTLNMRQQTLLVGATGAGKGSVMWSSVMNSYGAPEPIKFTGVDFKGGVEMGMGAHLFDTFVTDIDSLETLLQDYRDEMESRLVSMAGVSRKDETSTARVLVIDELTDVYNQIALLEKPRRDAMMGNLEAVLRKGRAPGFTVWAATQTPDKKAVPHRDLFTQKIALRLASDIEQAMVLKRESLDVCRVSTFSTAETNGGHGLMQYQDINPETGAAVGAVKYVEFKAYYPSDADLQTFRPNVA